MFAYYPVSYLTTALSFGVLKMTLPVAAIMEVIAGKKNKLPVHLVSRTCRIE